MHDSLKFSVDNLNEDAFWTFNDFLNIHQGKYSFQHENYVFGIAQIWNLSTL